MIAKPQTPNMLFQIDPQPSSRRSSISVELKTHEARFGTELASPDKMVEISICYLARRDHGSCYNVVLFSW